MCIGSLPSLTLLVVSRNALNTLPDSLGNLGKLKKISLGSNLISQVPNTFNKLENLECIELRYLNTFYFL